MSIHKFLSVTLIFSLTCFFGSCESPLVKGTKIPESSAAYVWKELYLKKDLNGKRISLAGYINIDNYVERNNENYCALNDAAGRQMLNLNISTKMKNSVDIVAANEGEEHNIHYIEIDKAKSSILDNEGKKLSFNQKVLVSFDIRYAKRKDTGVFPTSEVMKDGQYPFAGISKKGEQAYVFNAENIRIDKID